MKRVVIAIVLLALVAIPPAFASTPADNQAPASAPQANAVRISQAYGSGGNSGAVYLNDYIELFNAGATSVSLNGWSVQYASATGTGNFGATATQITELPNVTLAPGHYYLIQEASGGSVGIGLPTPDLTDATPINLSGTNGKVALANIAVSLGCNGGSTPCSPSQLANIVDLVGYGTANFYEGSGTAPALSSATAALRNGDGCTDTDNNAADFTAGAPNPRNSATTAISCGGDLPPTVSNTIPANGATDVAQTADLTVTFSEPVTVTNTWFAITCTTSLAHTAAVAGGPTTYTLNPDVDFTLGESCSGTVYAAQVADQDGTPDNMAADHVWSFATAAADPCSQPYTHTYQIQGSGAAAAITGAVTTQGVVVGDYELPTDPGQIKGFYLQDLTGDSDAATSDGLFIYDGGMDNVSVGQVVRVTGNAGEFQEQTQVSSTAIVQCGATGSVTPVDVSLPFAAADSLERYEGMLVRLPQTLYVTEHFQLGRFGQVVLTSNADRLQQPTNVALPGAPALAVQAANNLDRIIVDDDTNVENPDPIKFGRSGNPLSASNTLRGGDSATGIVGVLVYGWAGNSASGNAYRVRPIAALDGAVNFQPTNARPATPGEISGRLRVAAGNVLNFFNTFGAGACTNGVGGTATDCRGAGDATEFARQWPKTVANLVGGDADVIGFMEMENDGYDAASAIQDLVNKMNDATSPGAYAFIDVDARTGQINALGTDAIKVGLIYKPAKVTPVGVTGALNTTAFVNGGDSAARNRPALAQAFEEVGTGARFVVSVNHFKSKGSACDTPDAGDGQGNCNVVRTNAANALAAWLAGDPTGVGDPDILITGDLNAYAKEDPITAIINSSPYTYTNLIADRLGQSAYSYAFDGQWGYLDHALVTAALAAQATGIVEWHINADEPSALDYNTDYKSAGQLVSLYAADQYRSSDHDPIIIGLDLCATAATPTGLDIAQSGASDVALTWPAAPNAATYSVWRDTTPYFTPVGAPITTTVTTSYVDGGRIGDPTTNYYYVITASNACGEASGISNRVGEFDFALTPGQ